MPMTTALRESGVLSAEEVAMLSQVYQEITTSPNYVGDKPAREALARKILEQFKSGVSDPYELRRICAEP